VTGKELSGKCNKKDLQPHGCYNLETYYIFVIGSTSTANGNCNSEVGWDYYGNDEKSTSGQNTIDDCRKYCRQTCGVKCKYFTYINDGRCWCKTSEAGRTKNHNFGNTITSGALCESSTTTTTASKFTIHEGYNCFPGAGGEKIATVPEPYNANLHLADCQKACEDNKDCEGFVMPNDVITYQASGNCFLRKDLKLDKCGTGSTYSTYRKITLKDRWIKSKAGWVTEDNVKYPGGDLKGWKVVTRTDAEECRKLCKENNANFFTFMKTSKTCWCKETKGEIGGNGPEKDTDAISGTSDDCDGNVQAGVVHDGKVAHFPAFRCESGDRHVYSSEVCDTYKHCSDNSDEKFCGDNCGGWDDQLFRCNPVAEPYGPGYTLDTTKGHCFPLERKCSGTNDCNDGSDEANCADNCGVNFRCATTGDCIPLSYKCDGGADCDDGSDEANCPA